MSPAFRIFLTGGTGYIGSPLVAELIGRGHAVCALVRNGSQHKLPTGCTAVVGDALNHTTYVAPCATADAFVHLVGVAHPDPSKAEPFRSIDLASAREAVAAATAAGVRQFVYASVAHPASVMKAYWLGARRLGLVTLAQMLHALVWTIERPATALRVLVVPDIRHGALEDT
ncbi:MAG: NAD-dependent epimerase/dehydratase family protein [Gemmatimonadales bacterium]